MNQLFFKYLNDLIQDIQENIHSYIPFPSNYLHFIAIKNANYLSSNDSGAHIEIRWSVPKEKNRLFFIRTLIDID